MWKKETLRRIQLGALIAVIVVFIIYIMNKFLLYNQFDTSCPEISFVKEMLEVSVEATEEELLADVTARDKKDGDVTDSLMIEGMSNLLEGNERIVTYVAFDKDNHVSKAERRIKYTDYKPIRFSLVEPMKVSLTSSSDAEMLAPLRATDCIDGDISDQIVIAGMNMSAVSMEEMTAIYDVQVTSSSGEVASLQLPLKLDMTGNSTSSQFASIELKEYLIYAKVGEEIGYMDYVKSVTWRGDELSAEYVEVESNANMEVPGTYIATYTFTQEEVQITCDLIIVVEE